MRRTFLRAIVLGALAAYPAFAAATILLFDQARDAGTQSIVGPPRAAARCPGITAIG
jgi:hypothetical protein